MNKHMDLGERVLKRRKEKGLTQERLADFCKLDTRTIQRIEKGDVKPHFTTIRILSQVLEQDFIEEINSQFWEFEEQEVIRYKKIFEKKKRLRIFIFFTAMILLLTVAALFPSFELFGMAKRTWAPFFYIIMFCILVAIGLIWRCPVCNAHMGNPFSVKFCSKCGFRFSED